jgi:hypothetical protein
MISCPAVMKLRSLTGPGYGSSGGRITTLQKRQHNSPESWKPEESKKVIAFCFGARIVPSGFAHFLDAFFRGAIVVPLDVQIRSPEFPDGSVFISSVFALKTSEVPSLVESE